LNFYKKFTKIGIFEFEDKKNKLDAPKFVNNDSTRPAALYALQSALAKKNNVPTEPPNSGPNARLIMSKVKKENLLIL
jgi:hypothetical protein